MQANKRQVEQLTDEVVGLREQLTGLVAMVSTLVGKGAPEGQVQTSPTADSASSSAQRREEQKATSRKHKARADEDDDDEKDDDEGMGRMNRNMGCRDSMDADEAYRMYKNVRKQKPGDRWAVRRWLRARMREEKRKYDK